MKILVFGDNGFVGAETVKLFKERGLEVVGFDIMNGSDIRDQDQVEQAILKSAPDRILLLAAVARFADADRDPKLAHEVNVHGAQNVATSAHRYHIPVVFASTGSVYMPIKLPPPITEDFPVVGNSQYGCSKLLAELYVKTSGVTWMILRYAHLYGATKVGHGLVGGFLDRIRRGMAPVLYGAGRQSNDFCYVKDIAEANYLAVVAPWDKWNQVYNIGTGEELTAAKAGEIICRLTGWKDGVDHIEERGVDPERFVYDVGKAKTQLNFVAKYRFEEGLKDMLSDMGLLKV